MLERRQALHQVFARERLGGERVNEHRLRDTRCALTMKMPRKRHAVGLQPTPWASSIHNTPRLMGIPRRVRNTSLR